MICGSTTPPFYYGFMCDENRFWGNLYLIQVYFFCFIATLLTLYLRNDPTKYHINAAAYILAGYSTTPGIVHLSYYTDELLVRSFAMWPWLLGGIFYAVGAILFATHFPERLFPESRFIATWLQGHTIFHCLILAAAFLHFWASLRVFHERQVFPFPESGVITTNIDHFTHAFVSNDDL